MRKLHTLLTTIQVFPEILFLIFEKSEQIIY